MNKGEHTSESQNELRRKIEDYYFPKQLMEAILANGSLLDETGEYYLGIAFLDIVNYSYLSRFLTPKENQILLNGLYTAIHNIIIKYEGYLNKIEGDGMMFHFGGPLDTNVVGVELDKQLKYISHNLFYSCVEIQKVCILFNQANNKFLEKASTDDEKNALLNAFKIIKAIRKQSGAVNHIDALFQVRTRIGASIGEVTVGNFGPHGAKQWDVIGSPVIVAKRMETTAPIGGFRISETFYRLLEKYEYVHAYAESLRNDAKRLNNSYKNIRNDEVFHFRRVVIKEKNNATFETYSIQTDPSLPSNMIHQINALLKMDEAGATKITELILHYQGNHYVIHDIEMFFEELKIQIYKTDLLQIIFPKKYKELAKKYNLREDLVKEVHSRYSLFELFQFLGRYKDAIDQEPDYTSFNKPFSNYSEMMKQYRSSLDQNHEKRQLYMVQRAYFHNIVQPLVFASLKNCILEYQTTLEEQSIQIEELEEVDA